jgi:transposase
MKRLVGTEEAARMMGITPRAIRKKFNKGKIEGEFTAGARGGKGGQVLKVWIDDEPQTRADTETRKNGESAKKPNPGNRYRAPQITGATTVVKRGEPGRSIVTPLENGQPIPISNIPIGTDDKLMGAPLLASLCLAPPPRQVADGGGFIRDAGGLPKSESLPVPAVGVSRDPVISPRASQIANLRFALVSAFNEEAAKNHRPKKEIVQSFLSLYNAGISHPAIYNDIKAISRATLYNWLHAYKDFGIDGLLPQYRGAGQSGVLPGEKDFLLKFLLHQNQPKISDGIKECKRYLGEHSPSGISTLRRFVNHFKTYHHDTWTLRRKGEKAWNDEVAPYQDRDPMLLNVGDVIVADGHKLNLNVLDPITGKKKRATLVLFWDWKSTYPLGWEIMFSENVQCIAVALRNALLTLGKIPSNIYIDNGRAFLAKIFTRKVRIEDTEIPGMIGRLGSQYRRATPYHGQSKPIERFFLIINDRLERRIPSYTGASPGDKPAYLRRNEILAQKLHDNWTPTADDVFNIMLQWREEYVDEPRPRREGFTARQLFEEGRGAGLDPKALCFLMMAVEVKTVRRSRFTFAGTDWEGPCLYGYKGKIIIRYSLSDFSKIYVFDMSDRYLGTVGQCGKADPIKDWQAAKRIVSERRMLKRGSKEFAAFLVEGRRNPDLIGYIETEEANKPQGKIIPFFSDSNAAETVEGAVPGISDQEVPELLDGRPRWKYDYEKYDWLMEQAALTPEDRKWIDEYRASSSLYKHTVFSDGEELNRKVMEAIDERSLCRD